MSKNLRRVSMVAVLLLTALGLWSDVSAQQVVIGATTGTTTSYLYGPYYRSSAASTFNYSRYAYVYTAAELGIPAGATITSIDWYKASGTVTGNNTFNIFLNNTSATSLVDGSTWGTLTTGATQVYGSTTQAMTAAANSYETFPLTTTYTYTGGSLLILTDWVKAGTASGANNFYYNSAPGKALGYANSSALSTSTALSAASYGDNRPTIRITYIPGTPCAGTPAAGTASSTSTTACTGNPFTISLTGASIGSGLTYQLQSSPAGANTFTNVGTAQTSFSFPIASQSASTDYRIVTICANGGATATSSIVSVTQNSFISCYCTPVNNCTNEYIKTVSINGYSNNTGVCNGGGYGSFVATSATTLSTGSIYPVTVLARINDASSQVGVWIDYDHSGTFDASEFTLLGTGPTTGYANTDYTFTNSVSIPSGALLGNTRMRVRSANGTGVSATSACQTSNAYGETEDYLITIVAGAPCSGTPSAGTASSTATSVCSGAAFTLSTAGYTSGVTGITFQWQSSPAGTNTFTNITGATGPTYTASAGQTAATDYRVIVTCGNGGGSATSNVVNIVMNSFLACYCTVSSTYGCASYGSLSNVTLNTLTHAPGCATASPYYTDVPAATATTTILKTLAYPLTISIAAYSTAAVWIDFNQNGTFEASEYTALGTNSTSSAANLSASITVPASALTGLTKMRIRTEYYGYTLSATSACGNTNYGQTDDYSITVATGTPCSGTPAAPVAASSVSSVCSGVNFTLSATGIPLTETGYTYQWQSSPAGAGTFTNITGATTNPYTAAQTTATDYQLVITCSNSSASATSGTVTVSMSSFLVCYCSAQANNTSDEEITNVTFDAINNSSVCASLTGTQGTATGTADKYSDWTSSTVPKPSLNQGVTYAISVTLSECAGNNYTRECRAYVDWNQNGVFTDAGESYLIYANANPANLNYIATSSIAVPSGASLGTTRMRIILNEGVVSGPCTNPSWGEVEDYYVKVISGTACNGTPPTVTATSSVTTTCPNSSFTLSATGLPSSSGINYQWQSRPAGSGTFTNITGATTSIYTVPSQAASTDYRLLLTCINSSLSTPSNTVTVTQGQYYQCYCSTGLGGAANTASIDTVNLFGTTLNNITPGSAPTLYTAYPQSGSTTATINQGVTYTLHTAYGNGPAIASLWIDYDHSGTFDASEFTQITTSSSSVDVNFTVPAGALLGSTGLRIRSRSAGNPNGANDACSSFGSGETEDYIVTIGVGTPCSGTPTAGTATAPATVCSGVAFTLSATGATSGVTGITYQWQSRTAGTGTFANITGATTNPYTLTTGQTAAMDYRLVVTCANGGGSATSSTVTVGMSSFVSCYCSSAATTVADEEILNVTVGTLNQSSTCSTTGTGPTSVLNEYSDYTTGTGAPAAPSLGQTVVVPFSVQVGSCGTFTYSSGTAIFIDYNQNGSFADPGEMVANSGATTMAFPYTFTGTFIVPATATLGTTRMRVINAESVAGSTITPCLSYGYGETEDYLVTIIAPPSCVAPSAAAVTAISNSGANVSWTCTGCTGTFIVEYGAPGFTPGTGAIAGTGGTIITNATNPQAIGGLAASTNYTVYVRQNCGAGSFSLNSQAVNFTTAAACATPTALVISGLTPTTASIGWTCTACTGTFVVEYGQTGFTPGTGATAGTGGTVITNATNPQSLGTSLTPGTSYTVYVRQNCGGSTFGANASQVFITPLLNDDAPGAIAVTLGAGCTGAAYTNLNATQSTGEPFSACRGTAGYHTVWYKFVAPASGAVRVSTDAGSGNTMTDSRVSIFSTTNVNNYSTFTNLSCDDDGGSVVGGALSVAYVTGLTGGQTYYVQVDGYSSSDMGTFCMTVDQLSSSMIASGGSCVAGQTTYTSGTGTYTGFVSVSDASSNLIALVKVPAGMPSTGPSFAPSVTTNTAAVRSAVFDGVNQKYLDRNYLITSTVTGATIQFFFLNSELTALTTADPATTLSKLNVTEQSGSTCQPNFAAANGTNINRFQTGSGTSNGASWVQVGNASFSNFYLHRSSAIVNVTAALRGDIITTGANTGMMRNDLQTYFTNFGVPLLPTTDPYSLGATYANINSTTGIAGTVVDWVRLEARNATNATTLATPVESHAVLLKPNGTMVDPVTGTAPLFDAHPYPVRMVVKHRNHLAIMSNDITTFLDVTNYDFTTALTQASTVPGDPAQMTQAGGKWCMWAGDVNQDLGIDGTDKGQEQSAVNAGAFDVYSVYDLNMDGGNDGTDLGLENFSVNTSPYSTLLNY